MPATFPPDQILFEDDSLLIINKPAGLAMIPGRGESDSALEQLGRLRGLPTSREADPRLRVVHRLDKETSGALAFALTLQAQRHLSHQFQNNTVQKEYLALVAGSPLEDQGTIDAPIGEHPTIPQRMMVSKHGRPALTLWTVERRFRQHTLLRVRPRTGKTHQIRVHLRHIGLPLAVDALYGGPGSLAGILLSSFKRGYRPKAEQEERPLIARLTLHAQRLGLQHPDGRSLEVEAPLPKDMRAVLQALEKYSMR